MLRIEVLCHAPRAWTGFVQGDVIQDAVHALRTARASPLCQAERARTLPSETAGVRSGQAGLSLMEYKGRG